MNQINIYDRHYDLLDTIYINYSSSDPFRPSSYKGNSLSWQGRRLTSFGTNSYSYNSEGIRISKITTNGTYTYVLDDKKIIKETKPTYGTVYYHYDEEGMLVGFHYNNNEYFYVRDLTGNIAKVLDANGNIKVEYKYNAWGKVLSVTGDNTIKNVNSYLYKGYYYDFETELYYCNSRYYDPDVCRWISIDEFSFLDYQNIDGINLWCYCGNNPVMRYDHDGYWSWRKFWSGVLIASAVVAAAAFVVAAVVAPPIVVPIAAVATSTVSVTGVAVSVGAVAVGVGIVSSIACNISAINESEKLIQKYSDVKSMSDERYDAINSASTKYDVEGKTSGDTSNLDIIDSIAYIRKARENKQTIAENWTEAEMLRELLYHQKGYYISEFLGDPFRFSDNLVKVDFEEDKKFMTYLKRYIGNCLW